MPNVMEGECIGCGLCADACPADAIEVGIVAKIDEYRCSGCGACIGKCPQSAIMW